ncbi:hypothetical protein [Nocardia sp. AG03]|uniref:hypothetical protein n=1 Tax=Nocardia sp. AG03 TaxID=3025312 RepID=UPI00241868C2|nr:hypothetical protein [Nocardia sp. AG03]
MSYTEAELTARYRALGSGWHAAVLAELEEIVAHADAGGHHRLAFRARRDLANRHCVSGQWDRGFPLFARCLSDYDRRPDDYGPQEEWSLRSWYVRTVRTMIGFPEVELSRITALLADIRRRFAAGGHGLAGVHEIERLLALQRGDWDAEEQAHRQWVLAGGPTPHDPWDLENEIERHLHRGDPASIAHALRLAQPLRDGEISPESAPYIAVTMLPFWAEHADDERLAALYERMADGFAQVSVYPYEYSGMAIEFLARTGNEENGLTRFRRLMCHFTTLDRPHGRLEFATSCTVLLARLVALGRGPERMPCHGCERGHPETTIAELHTRMRTEARTLAARFDARNGTAWQTTRVERRLAAAPLREFLPLFPGARPTLHAVQPIDAPAEVAVHCARWYFDRGLWSDAKRYLDLIQEPAPPAVAAAVLELRARYDEDASTVPRLREAVAAYAAAGEYQRHDLCLVAVADRLKDEKRYPEAYAEITAPMERLRAHADPDAVVWAETVLADILFLLDRDDEARDIAERALTLAATVPDPMARARAGYQLGRMRVWWKESPATVAADLVPALTACIEAGAEFLARRCLERLVERYTAVEDQAGLAALLARCLRETPPTTGRMVIAELRYRYGWALHLLGRDAEAVDELSFAAYEYDALDLWNVSRRLHWIRLAEVCAALGRWERAHRHAQHVCTWAENARANGTVLTDAADVVTARYVLADALRELDRPDATLTAYRTLAEDALAADKRDFARYAHLQAAELLLRADRPGPAAQDYRRAADLATELDKSPRQQRDYRVREVIAHVRAGDLAAAESALEQARAVPARDTDDHARLDLATAHTLFAQGRGPEAHAHAVRAVDALHATGYHGEAATAALFCARIPLADQRPDLAAAVLRSSLARCPGDLPQARELSAMLASVGSG